MLSRPALGIAVACGLALACATPTPPELIAARDTVAAAKSRPLVQERASVELYEAEQALQRAEQAWDTQQDAEEASHLAYVTTRKTERATLAAEAREAVAEARRLSEQRDRIRLQARTREAEASLSAAERARREAERRAVEAERARLDAETARSEAETAREAAEAAAAREAELRQQIEELQAKETDRGIVLTLGDVLFDVDQATLKPGAMQNLYRLVTFLKEHPDRPALVEGHTDSTGAEAYNVSLSQRRADAVVTFLVENGIEPSRLLARGYGPALPVATNATAEGRQRNRRVEVVILDPGADLRQALRPTP